MTVSLEQMGLEAIDFQPGNRLFQTLSLCFDRLKGIPADDDVEQRKVLVEILTAVKVHTGILISLRIINNDSPNAFVELQPITRDHPFFDASYRAAINTFVLREASIDKLMQGKVDLKAGKVSGLWSTIEHPTTIHSGLLKDPFTGEEAAAVLLHELGHVFTYFELMGRTMVTNKVLQEVAETFSNTREKTVRVKILNDAEELFGHHFEDKNALAESDSVDVAVNTVLMSSMNYIRSELGTKFYDGRMCEFMADQFATRQGAGRALVSGLDKLHRSQFILFRQDPYKSTSQIIFINLMGYLKIAYELYAKYGKITPTMFLKSLLFGAMFRLLSLLIFGKNYTYDDPKARYTAVRRELVTFLKARTADQKDIIPILKQIMDVDGFINELSVIGAPEKMLIDFMHAYLNGSYKELKFQRQYEELANNDLFVRAAQLNQHAQG